MQNFSYLFLFSYPFHSLSAFLPSKGKKKISKKKQEMEGRNWMNQGKEEGRERRREERRKGEGVEKREIK